METAMKHLTAILLCGAVLFVSACSDIAANDGSAGIPANSALAKNTGDIWTSSARYGGGTQR
jgi:hypothetical protein